VGARSGFEVAFLSHDDDGLLLTGCTTAVEDDRAWVVGYRLRLDARWRTRSAHVLGRSGAQERSVTLATDGSGHWEVDGRAAPHLEGCRDVDLESSALTNALPVHRLRLGVGGSAAAPAAYVRALDLRVERLEQDYTRAGDDGGRQRYDYAAPAFGVSCRLRYDDAGLVVTYPGIAERAA
jgi:hypothetical protein